MEDFDDGDIEGWSLFFEDPETGNQITTLVTDGRLRAQGSCAQCDPRYLIMGRTNLMMEDFTVSIDLLGWAEGSGNKPAVALVARCDPSGFGPEPSGGMYMAGVDMAPPDYPGKWILWFWEVTHWDAQGLPVGGVMKWDFKAFDIPDDYAAKDFRLVFSGVSDRLTIRFFELTDERVSLLAEDSVSDPSLSEGCVGLWMTDTGPSGTMNFVFDHFVAVGTEP
jgi:hypothetical protein